MLVLSRKRNESIIISSDTEIKVMDIKRNSVKLGIESKSGAKVLRKELFLRLAADNKIASNKRAGSGEGIPAGDMLSPPEHVLIEKKANTPIK